MTQPGSWQPGRLREADVDHAVQRIFQAHYALEGQAVQAVGVNGGYRQVPGTTTVKGAKTGIATGLARVDHVTAVVDAGAVAFNQWLSARPSPSVQGAIDLYIWKPTGAGDNTPVVSTTAWLVRWIASGA